MMYGASNYAIWIHIHWFFVFLFLFAFAAGIVWLVRFANKETLKSSLWISLVVSILGLLLTAQVAYQGFGEMMNNMMDWDDDEAYLNSDNTDEDDNYENMQDRMEDMMDFDEDEEGTVNQ